MIPIDIARLTADIHHFACASRELKTILRATWTRPMREEQRELQRVRRRLTELHVLYSHRRGRQHLQKPLREGAYPGMIWDRDEWHAKIAERVAKDYARAASEAQGDAR